jgi:phage terminase large subunit-like protein
MKNKSVYYKILIKYCNNIIKGEILSGLYTKKAIKRFQSDLKKQKDEGFLFEFKPELAEQVMEFAESLYIPDLNDKLKLLPWQIFIYYQLFSWVFKDDNNRRRFRSSYIEIARKNGKTTGLLFPIILYDFLNTESAESYFVSADERQAYKSFQELKYIAKADEDLSNVINDTVSTITFQHSRISFFSSESLALDSYKNSCSVIDEFHQYSNDRVITAFKYGGRARKNCLVLIITSAGNNISGPCYTENEKAKKVLNNILTDDSYFTIIYAYDDKDDWKDPKLFIKANPSLNEILKQDILENDLNEALITPSHQSDFKSKTCGIWTNDTTNWISLQKWDTEKRNTIIDINEFSGKICYGGLDLSSIGDFTVFTLCFKKDGNYYLYHKYYVPSEQVLEKYRVENINIKEWIDNGLITAIPGATIDYSFIEKDIIEAANKYNLIELAYDNWNSNQLITKLDEIVPNTILVQYNQNLKQMSNPTKQFEKLIMDDKIVDPNPVSKWMVSNAVVKPDVNGNYKLLKEYKSSTKRIDSAITSIMSIDRAMNNDEPNTTNDFNSILNLF